MIKYLTKMIIKEFQEQKTSVQLLEEKLCRRDFGDNSKSPEEVMEDNVLSYGIDLLGF